MTTETSRKPLCGLKLYSFKCIRMWLPKRLLPLGCHGPTAINIKPTQAGPQWVLSTVSRSQEGISSLLCLRSHLVCSTCNCWCLHSCHPSISYYVLVTSRFGIGMERGWSHLQIRIDTNTEDNPASHFSHQLWGI